MTNSKEIQFSNSLLIILTEGLRELKKTCSYRASSISLDSLSYRDLKDEYWAEIPCFEADAFEELQDIVGYYEDLETAKADGKTLTKLQDSILQVYRDDREEEVNKLLSLIMRKSEELKHWKNKCADALEYLEQI